MSDASISEAHALVVAADLEAIRAVGAWLHQAAEATEVIDPNLIDHKKIDLGAVELALQELAVNIVEHGYAGQPGTIEWHLRQLSDGAIEVTAVDNAAPSSWELDGAARRAPGEVGVRGYGLMIIDQVARSFDHENIDGKNHWRLVFGAS